MDKQPPNTIHYSQLKPLPTPGLFSQEWDTYLREVDRLIAEGKEGQFVLIHGDEIIGLFDAEDTACTEGYRRYLLAKKAFIVHQILKYEPLLRAG